MTERRKNRLLDMPGAPPRCLSHPHAGTNNGCIRARLWHSASLWTRPVKGGGQSWSASKIQWELQHSARVGDVCQS